MNLQPSAQYADPAPARPIARMRVGVQEDDQLNIIALSHKAPGKLEHDETAIGIADENVGPAWSDDLHRVEKVLRHVFDPLMRFGCAIKTFCLQRVDGVGALHTTAKRQDREDVAA